jgi:hypothetical protein
MMLSAVNAASSKEEVMKNFKAAVSVVAVAVCAALLVGCPGGLLGAPAIEGTWRYTSIHEEGSSYMEALITFGALSNGEGTFKYVVTTYNPKSTDSANKEIVETQIEGKYKLSNASGWAQGAADVIASSYKNDEEDYTDGKTTHTLVDVEYDEAIPFRGLYAFDSAKNLLFAWDLSANSGLDMNSVMTLMKE